ncbi:MAG: type II secretion system protein GspE [Clostridia bacterium]|nr:type II secretion system protein GspE [Clostridia bacterium]
MRIEKKKMRLGDILIAQGVITESQLEATLQSQQKGKRARLGDLLIEAGVTTEGAIARALHVQLGIEYVELRGVKIPQEVIGLVSGSILRKHKVLPLGFDENDSNVLLLAMADPLDMIAQDDIAIVSNYRVEPRIATASEINLLLDKYFGTEEAMSAAERYTKEREQQNAALEEAALQEDNELNSAPIVQLVKTMIEQAVRQRASDIHIEALERQVRVRYRIDGVLSEKMVYDISLLPAIVTRIKILGGMDISEKRRPQDGHISISVDLREYDIRVSVLPTAFGEKVVMRITSATALQKNKAELGLRPDELRLFDHILANPNGIILVTGPTGSGKSSTLYTALSELNTPDVNIVTVEDPIEANIPGINQINVNTKANLTFANALRAILRQDPDIIMIGEIRDVETASIAVQASITGHLVVSTLHTNSSAATITRLMDMGIEPFLIADSIVGVIAQRLVRRLCPSCRRARPATESEKLLLGVPQEESPMIYDAVGCSLCAETGYYGRIGVFEIMTITPQMKKIIADRGSTEAIKNTALENGLSTLRMSAAKYVLEGTTTVQEMLKISFEE